MRLSIGLSRHKAAAYHGDDVMAQDVEQMRVWREFP